MVAKPKPSPESTRRGVEKRPHLDPIPAAETLGLQRPAQEEQRWRELRETFLREFPSITAAELPEHYLRGLPPVPAAKPLGMPEAASPREIMSVDDGGVELYPLFQFKNGRLRASFSKAYTSLQSAGLTDWEVVMWFTSPNSWLGDWERPVDLLDRDPEGVVRAAEIEAVEAEY